MVLELLSSKSQVCSVPTKDPDACQEKQHTSCIFASVVQAFKYYLKSPLMERYRNYGHIGIFNEGQLVKYFSPN